MRGRGRSGAFGTLQPARSVCPALFTHLPAHPHQVSEEAWREAGPRPGLTLLLPPASTGGKKLSARHNQDCHHHDNQSPASGQVPGRETWAADPGEWEWVFMGDWMLYPLGFGIATDDEPSSQVARVTFASGGPACCGWVLRAVSPGRPRVVVAAPPWPVGVPSVALRQLPAPPASSVGRYLAAPLIPRLAIGQSWPWPQMTLARPGPRSDLPLTSPPPEPRTSVQLDPQLWPCVCVLGEETVAGFKFFQESRPQES